MGKILPSYKKAIIEDVMNSILSNTSQYYVFASHPIPYSTVDPPVETNEDYNLFVNDWNMLFGKKVKYSDIAMMIEKNIWTSNTVYDRYDNTSNTLHIDNNFYVITEPSIVGGTYNVYKCIDNANGEPSTFNPGSIGNPTQTISFQTSDNYVWRYISSISSINWDRFSTTHFAPVYTNPTVSAFAKDYSGVEVVVIANGGSGYSNYANGTIQNIISDTILQIDSSASTLQDFYNNTSIYIYNIYETGSQLKTISNYISNGSGKFVVLESAANTETITPEITSYIISPKVVFETDGVEQPTAYSVVNSYASNAISKIVILNNGSEISRANVYIQSTPFGSGANLYAIVPPPGGHGSSPASELNIKGFCISTSFANTEGNTIFTKDILFNKIGIIKNPYSSNSSTGEKLTTRFSSNTFNQIFVANVSTPIVFDVGETVFGVNSGAVGYVVYSNSSQVYLTGDKSFFYGEKIKNEAETKETFIDIQTFGQIYAKDLTPLYVQNINNSYRANSQTEMFKIVIQV